VEQWFLDDCVLVILIIVFVRILEVTITFFNIHEQLHIIGSLKDKQSQNRRYILGNPCGRENPTTNSLV
jgi:hypothetical protein